MSVLRFRDLIEDWEDFAYKAHQRFNGEAPRAISTGISRFDEAIGGYLTLGLHFIQGGPGVGKTAFALQIACECGSPSLFVTCEMRPLELFLRTAARITKTPLGTLKSGELTPEKSLEIAKLTAARCSELVILDGTDQFLPCFDSEYSECNIYDVATLNFPDTEQMLIVIDSLHSWADRVNTKILEKITEYEYLNRAITSLQSLALALKSPILITSERNRQSIEKGGLSAGAGTRKIEYSAETVIELDVKQNTLEVDGKRLVVAKLSKNRNGEPGKQVELAFNGSLQQYTEID